MATPMSYVGPDKFMCCQCFGGFPLSEATFDLYNDEPFMNLVDVCKTCRIYETYWMIRYCAGYED